MVFWVVSLVECPCAIVLQGHSVSILIPVFVLYILKDILGGVHGEGLFILADDIGENLKGSGHLENTSAY
jgi:hypothetical protein